TGTILPVALPADGEVTGVIRRHGGEVGTGTRRLVDAELVAQRGARGIVAPGVHAVELAVVRVVASPGDDEIALVVQGRRREPLILVGALVDLDFAGLGSASRVVAAGVD